MSQQTLEQIQAAREALNQQEAAIRQAAREEQARKDEEKRKLVEREKATRKQMILQAIKDELHILRPNLIFMFTSGDNLEINGGSHRDPVNGDTVYMDIRQRYNRHGSYRRDEIPGSYDITVGNYGDKKRFPPKKDNTHSYANVALEIISRYDKVIFGRRDAEMRANNKAANMDDATALRSEFNLKEHYGDVQVGPSTSEAGKVWIKIERAMSVTPEQAQVILTKLVELGILKQG